MEVQITGIQARLAEICGPDHYYTKQYMGEELKYCGHIVDWMAECLPPLGPSAKILDIGPGYGTLAAYAQKLTGGAVYTVDRLHLIAPKVEAEFGLLCGIGDVERQDIPADDLDAVIMTEVLEHFNFYPVPTMLKVHAAMREGGKLFLSTPDSSSKWGKCNRFRELAGIPAFDPMAHTYDNPAWIDGHVYQYAWHELDYVLRQSGFTPKYMLYSHSPGGNHFNVLAIA